MTERAFLLHELSQEQIAYICGENLFRVKKTFQFVGAIHESPVVVIAKMLWLCRGERSYFVGVGILDEPRQGGEDVMATAKKERLILGLGVASLVPLHAVDS